MNATLSGESHRPGPFLKEISALREVWGAEQSGEASVALPACVACGEPAE
jgi:hypothetical protein